MSMKDHFVELDRWAMSRVHDRPDHAASRWLPVLPVLIPLLIGTIVAAVIHSSALWLGTLIGVALAASLILNARESG